MTNRHLPRTFSKCSRLVPRNSLLVSPDAVRVSRLCGAGALYARGEGGWTGRCGLGKGGSARGGMEGESAMGRMGEEDGEGMEGKARMDGGWGVCLPPSLSPAPHPRPASIHPVARILSSPPSPFSRPRPRPLNPRSPSSSSVPTCASRCMLTSIPNPVCCCFITENARKVAEEAHAAPQAQAQKDARTQQIVVCVHHPAGRGGVRGGVCA